MRARVCVCVCDDNTQMERSSSLLLLLSWMPHLQELSVLRGHAERVWCVAWAPSGDMLATCGGDKTVRVWQRERQTTATWRCLQTLEDAHTRTIRSVAWSPSGRYLASVSFDATTVLWEQKEHGFERVATMEGHEHEVKSVSFSVSGQHLATCSRDKSVWVWEVVESGGECECVAVLSGHAQDVKMVRWHPTQEVLASCGYDDTIKIWKEDEYDWSDIHTMEGHDSTVWGICFNVDGSKLVSCSDDRTIIVWESVEDMAWRQACTLSGYHDRAIYTVDWSHVTGRIASGSGADDIAVFEAVPTGREEPPSFVCTVKHERAHQGDVNSVQWNPHQGNMLASAGDDGLVRIWEYCEG